MTPTRRGLLATSAAALAGFAGCTASPGGSGSGSADGITLEAAEVGGSPGGEVAVRPQGEPALLDFFATWCAPCKPQMDHLRTVRERFLDVHMLSITWEDDADAIRSFWRDYDGTWPVASDPEVRTGQEYGVERIPTMIVFAPDGTEVWRHVGLADAETVGAKLEAAQ